MSYQVPAGVEFPGMAQWPVTLRYQQVVLRPLRRSDRAQWDRVRLANREWLKPWDATSPIPSHPGPRSFGQMARRYRQQARQGIALPWALCWDAGWPERPTFASDCPLAGQLTVAGITYGSARLASVGYWIDRGLAGRGLMPTAVALATDYCHQVLGLHRVEVHIRPENTNSLRVVEKLGFRPEGMKPKFLHINGDWRDHYSFALHDDEVPEGLLNRYLADKAN